MEDWRVGVQVKSGLYGLKQSPCAWFGRFTEAMLPWVTSRVRVLMFLKHSQDGKLTILLVHVDDIIITGDVLAKRQ